MASFSTSTSHFVYSFFPISFKHISEYLFTYWVFLEIKIYKFSHVFFSLPRLLPRHRGDCTAIYIQFVSIKKIYTVFFLPDNTIFWDRQSRAGSLLLITPPSIHFLNASFFYWAWILNTMFTFANRDGRQ